MSVRKAIVLVGLVSFAPSGAALAQANGDPGSAMLGIAAARAHAEARSGRGIERWRQALNAWQELRKIVYRETP